MLIQVTCQVSNLTMEYVIFSCTQGKVGGGTAILELICFLNISLLLILRVTSSKFQLSITLGKKLHVYEVVLEWRFKYSVTSQIITRLMVSM